MIPSRVIVKTDVNSISHGLELSAGPGCSRGPLFTCGCQSIADQLSGGCSTKCSSRASVTMLVRYRRSAEAWPYRRRATCAGTLIRRRTIPFSGSSALRGRPNGARALVIPLTSSPLFSVLFLAIHQMPLSSISPTDRASISPTQPMGYVYDGLLIEKLQERNSN